jgi:hypothetical protein
MENNLLSNALNEKSDVGFKKSVAPLADAKFLNDLMLYDTKYHKYTEAIRGRVSNIFEQFLTIGFYLNEIDKEQLFEISSYESVYEYASKEFDLSITTVKNTMAISNRFCDKNGNLKKEFEKYSYSSLVELIPVPDCDLENYNPVMTVKDIRSKKLESKIGKYLKESMSETGFVSKLIDRVKNFDFDTNLNLIGCEVTHTISKVDYKSSSNLYMTIGIDFHLINKTRKIKKFDFFLNMTFRDSFDIRLKSDSPWMYKTIANEKDIDLALKELCKTHIESGLVLDEKVKESKQEVSPGLSKVTDLRIYDQSKIDDIAKKAIISSFETLYCEMFWGSGNNYDFYAEPKRNKKKNPKLYSIKNLTEPGKAVIEIYNEDETVKRTIPIFPEFQEVYDKKLKDAFDDLKSYLNGSSSILE